MVSSKSAIPSGPVRRLLPTHTGLSHQTHGVTPLPHGRHASFRHGEPEMANQKESVAMKCLRIYATPDGESHFDEVELPTTKRSVHPDAVPFEVSASYQASRVRLTRIPAGMREVAWHTVPEPVLTVRLDGSAGNHLAARFGAELAAPLARPLHCATNAPGRLGGRPASSLGAGLFADPARRRLTPLVRFARRRVRYRGGTARGGARHSR
jgi:hypothetical protein